MSANKAHNKYPDSIDTGFLARILGIQRKAFMTWLWKKGVVPVGETARSLVISDIAPLLRQIFVASKDSAGNVDTGQVIDPADLQTERARFSKLKADQLARTLVDRRVMKAEVQTGLATMKSSLMNIPRALGHKQDLSVAQQKAVRERISEVLNEAAIDLDKRVNSVNPVESD